MEFDSEKKKSTTTKNAGKLLVYKKVNGTKELVRIFSLRMGDNTIGRPSERKPSDIEIPDDDYMSRQHFVIKICRNNNYDQLRYVLFDNGSRNGTFFNSSISESRHKLRTGDTVHVTEDDEILAGKTYFQLEPL